MTLAGAAPAAGAWLPSERLAGGGQARAPDVAMNARGDAVAAWTTTARGRRVVRFQARPAGRGWEAPRTISPRGGATADPQVAIGAGGQVVVAWRQVVGRRVVAAGGRRRTQAVYVARARERFLPGGRWGPVRTLSSSRQKVGPPAVGVDERGRAVAAWHWGTGTRPRDPGFVGQVQVAERVPGRGWGRAWRASRSSICVQVRLPAVAVGRRGHAVVRWQCDLPRRRSTSVAVSRAPGAGGWSRERELPFATAGDQQADLAVAPDGTAVAVAVGGGDVLRWWRGRVGEEGVRLGPLPAAGDPERAFRGAGPPRVAVGPDGSALTAWIDRARRARAAAIAPDLGVARPVTLAARSTASSPQVAAADGRRGLAAWLVGGRVAGAARTAAGGFSAPRAISRRGVIRASDSPRVAVDASGEGLAVWSRRVGRRWVVERAAYRPRAAPDLALR